LPPDGSIRLLFAQWGYLTPLSKARAESLSFLRCLQLSHFRALCNFQLPPVESAIGTARIDPPVDSAIGTARIED
jgi:hypothetical protein